MNPHALAVLEFPRVLGLVADRASSALGAARVRALQPTADRASLDGEHARVAAMRALAAAEGGWTPEPIPDLTQALARLRIGGTAWSGPELLGGLTLLRSSRRTQDALRDPRRTSVATAVLAPLADRLLSAKPQETAIERVLDDEGEVKDDATPSLRRIRRELRGSQGELVRVLERVMARLEPHQQVPDMSVTLRNGRYVIPIRANARAAVGGIVHDASASGATLFVEPPAAIEAGNRIRELRAAESAEVERVLRELTDELRPLHGTIAEALDALVELDSLYARARFAVEFRCAPAELGPPHDGCVIRDGRHPLLLAQGQPVVPFDLELLPGERTLLVSGPNTGGKTVLLKAIGLMSALVQAGVPVPVGPESRVAVFDDVFADVGDEQSIQASLSTFSAHVKNLAEILSAATSASLVLIDELGSGTDPLEGAALGGAILEELTRRRTLTVATTHLGALKELATEIDGVVNASLQFDPVELAPTYRLIKGVPGRSYGLSIARRLRLPEDVLARAEERVPKVERDVNALLADLESRDEELARREREVRAIGDDLRARMARVAEREARVRERERELERQARQEARRYVLEARNEIERTIKELKAAGADAIEETARGARQRAERMAADQAAALSRLDERVADRGRSDHAPEQAPVSVGDWVELSTFGARTGRLLDVRDGDAVVAVGSLKMTVPLASLTRSAHQPAAAPVTVPMLGDMPEVQAVREIDVRGMRVSEVDDIVMQALDAAVRADLKELRIIHGKGTGALRERVSEMLRKDTRVASFRLGAWNEGGAGATVAELK